MPVSLEMPSRLGPSHCGQSPADAAVAKNKALKSAVARVVVFFMRGLISKVPAAATVRPLLLYSFGYWSAANGRRFRILLDVRNFRASKRIQKRRPFAALPNPKESSGGCFKTEQDAQASLQEPSPNY